ncbi:MAG: VOC family protein [Pseudomonadota bacterium]
MAPADAVRGDSTWGDFVWCDLSSRRLDIACQFYAQLFGWQYETLQAADGSDYIVGANAAEPVAGLYTMPEKFQNMGMPCFWMSYIAVQSIDQAVANGAEHGGKVELGPLDWGDGSRVALIRDPLGAGFTVVEGGAFSARNDQPQHGGMAWNGLYVSDAEVVIPFYRRLFNWQISPHKTHAAHYDIANSEGKRISSIQELPEALRGKEQYWAIHFTVDDMANARETVIGAGGDYQNMGDGTAFVRDPDNASFLLTAKV